MWVSWPGGPLQVPVTATQLPGHCLSPTPFSQAGWWPLEQQDARPWGLQSEPVVSVAPSWPSPLWSWPGQLWSLGRSVPCREASWVHPPRAGVWTAKVPTWDVLASWPEDPSSSSHPRAGPPGAALLLDQVVRGLVLPQGWDFRQGWKCKAGPCAYYTGVHAPVLPPPGLWASLGLFCPPMGRRKSCGSPQREGHPGLQSVTSGGHPGQITTHWAFKPHMATKDEQKGTPARAQGGRLPCACPPLANPSYLIMAEEAAPEGQAGLSSCGGCAGCSSVLRTRRLSAAPCLTTLLFWSPHVGAAGPSPGSPETR